MMLPSSSIVGLITGGPSGIGTGVGGGVGKVGCLTFGGRLAISFFIRSISSGVLGVGATGDLLCDKAGTGFSSVPPFSI